MNEDTICPHCGSDSTIAKGFRYNRSGKVPLRRCKACKRRWTAGQVNTSLTGNAIGAVKPDVDKLQDSPSIAAVREEDDASPMPILPSASADANPD